MEISVPRDRNGEFEQQILGKYQRNASGLEEKILSLNASSMSIYDIKEQIKELCDLDISQEM